MRDPETGTTVPLIEIAHPEEWHAFANAVIERGRLERHVGREFPRGYVEGLAYAEDRVFDTQRALRIVMGVAP